MFAGAFFVCQVKWKFANCIPKAGIACIQKIFGTTTLIQSRFYG